jgi:hypothetical protein
MSELSGCPSCQGFNPPSAAACLHCGHSLEFRPVPSRRSAVGWWALAGAGVAALTLMACYGAPPCDHNDPNCYEPETPDGGLNDAGTDAGP